MSNFLSNLLKGFIRSAVNQVGKDGGKVISNQIYGNNHATPVNITSTNTTQTNTDDTPTQENNNVPFSFWHYAFKDYLLLKLLLYYILGFFMIILAPLYIILRGFEYSKRDYEIIYTIQQVAVGKPDKRYNSGVRVTGYRNQKVAHTVPASANAIIYYQKKGNIYKVLGALLLIINVTIIVAIINS